MRYRIVARVVNGTKCEGYMLIDENGNKGIKSKHETETMAINKMIDNCTAQMFNGNIVMKGRNIKLRELPCCDKNGNIVEKANNNIKQNYSIVGKVVSGREVTEYIIEDSETSKTFRMKRDEVIKLAYQRRISNAYIQSYNNRKIIRGRNGTDLNYIKTIYV